MLKKSGQISIFGQISIDPFLITFKLCQNPIIITPKRFNKTVLDESVHMIQHISFIFVGLIGFFVDTFIRRILSNIFNSDFIRYEEFYWIDVFSIR